MTQVDDKVWSSSNIRLVQCPGDSASSRETDAVCLLNASSTEVGYVDECSMVVFAAGCVVYRFEDASIARTFASSRDLDSKDVRALAVRFGEDEDVRGRELPVCVYCLARLDCFEKAPYFWSDVEGVGEDCATCRLLLDEEEHVCFSCGDSGALWACLVCGHVGCGRYSKEHAKAHFLSTNHSLSMEIATQRIWDYIEDGYAHRVTGVSHSTPVATPRFVSGPKLNMMASHYEAVLEAQLAAQREIYENKLAPSAEPSGAPTPASAARAEAAALRAMIAEARARLKEAKKLYNTLVSQAEAANANDAALTAKRHDRHAAHRARLADLQTNIRTLQTHINHQPRSQS